jgi:hypothetical protein
MASKVHLYIFYLLLLTHKKLSLRFVCERVLDTNLYGLKIDTQGRLKASGANRIWNFEHFSTQTCSPGLYLSNNVNYKSVGLVKVCENSSKS